MYKNYLIILCTIFYVLAVQDLFSQTFYVSPKGNDKNPGTLEKPLQTFQGAIKTINNAGGSGSVYFRDGVYHFDKTVVLNKENCKGEILFKAFPSENPVFTSLEPVALTEIM